MFDLSSGRPAISRIAKEFSFSLIRFVSLYTELAELRMFVLGDFE